MLSCFTERKRHRRLKDLQAKKQSIEEDSNEDNGGDKEATKGRKIGFSSQPPSQCNGLPFSSYLDSERSNPGSFDLPMGDNACKTQEDNTERVTVPESYGGMGGGGVGLGGSVSHHQLSPVQSSPEGAETTTMPNSTSNLSIGQDVNQNITADGANNASFKKRGSITFVITDHSDPNQERKNSDSEHSECSSTAADFKCPYHRKPSICESIPEEKASLTGFTDTNARLSQGSIQSGSILRLPPPSNRKSGRSMSECSDYHDYSLTPDGRLNYTG